MRVTFFTKDRLRLIGIIMLGALILCIPAFSNRFPFVYSDLGIHIDSGFRVYTPYERPLFYGLFVRHLSLASSLFLVVYIQSLLLSYLIFKTSSLLLSPSMAFRWFLPLIGFLTLSTGLAHFVSLLIPDALTAILFLSVLLLVFHPKLSAFERISLSVILCFTVMIHYSHVLIVGSLLILFFLDRWFNRKSTISWRKLLLPSGIYLFAVIAIPTGHYLADGKFQMSQLNHVVLMSRMMEFGILQDYLEDACEEKNYRICNYQDRLVSYEFVWSEKSPVQLEGGWEKNRDEYSEILRDIMSKPGYYDLLAQQMIEVTMVQFFNFDVDFDLDLTKTAPTQAIHHRYTHLDTRYLTSKQNVAIYTFEWLNRVQFILVISSIILILMIWINVFKTTDLLQKYAIAALAFCLINAFVCGSFSGSLDRYQCRVIWLIPFMALLIVINHFISKSEKLQ